MSDPQHRPFRKSKRSNSDNCVEVADLTAKPGVLVRDSKDPEGPQLGFDAAGWGSFLAGAKDGQFTQA